MSISPRELLIESDGRNPNGRPTAWPALHYVGAFSTAPASDIERRLASNGWQPCWRFPMYKQAHYHSTTHEALGIYRGRAMLQLGGELGKGVTFDVQAGDCLVLPAGYAHRALEDHDGFGMVGAYPLDRQADWDMRYGRSRAEGQADEAKIRAWVSSSEVPLDPVYGGGSGTPLRKAWPKP